MFRREAIANLLFAFGLPVLGLVMAIVIVNGGLHPIAATRAACTLYVVGFILFAKSKLALIMQGDLVSFGSGRMSPTNRRLYRVGYALMLLGVLATVGALVGPNVVKPAASANQRL